MKLATGVAVLLTLVLPGSAEAVTWQEIDSGVGKGSALFLVGYPTYALHGFFVEASSSNADPFTVEVEVVCHKGNKVRSSFPIFGNVGLVKQEIPLPMKHPDLCIIGASVIDSVDHSTEQSPNFPALSLRLLGQARMTPNLAKRLFRLVLDERWTIKTRRIRCDKRISDVGIKCAMRWTTKTQTFAGHGTMWSPSPQEPYEYTLRTRREQPTHLGYSGMNNQLGR